MEEIEAGVLDAAKCVDIMELCWDFLKNQKSKVCRSKMLPGDIKYI